MSDVHDYHHNEDGEQVTIREVTVTDATGEAYVYPFRVTEDGHEFQGEGDPSEAALDALDAWLTENQGSE